ncbi:MAG: branched-chain amino acid aminotransferase [Rhodospirillales bacterium]
MVTQSFDDRDGEIWLDGAFVPWRSAQQHVLNHGLHYASSVFEGERMYSGKIFKLAEHTERLFFSAGELGLKIPYSEAEINAACEDVCRRNNIVDGYIRPFAWRGSEMMAISAQDTTTHTAIAAWPWPSYFSPEMLEKGISLKTARYKRPSPETAPVHAKTAGLYAICTISKHEAEAAGFTDALLLDYRGYVSEGTGANIFFLMADGKLHTPTPDCFLDGITRRTVIELARARGVEVVERHIKPDEIAAAKEVFFTGTAAEVTPIGRIDDMTFKVGEVTRALMEDYSRAVGKTPAAQSAA